MAGFDYNRGGIPTGDGQVAQPDEQIEYAGPTAVVFRANFNYNVASSVGNGLELNYEPKNIKNAPIFPYVTTSNDEIIAYVLRSNDSSKNTSSIKFYVDDYLPRAAFPSSISPAPKDPSHPEEMVTISNIDTSNANPPYTLYRMTLSDVKAGNLGTPVAENVRSMKFTYYTDAIGKTLLTNPDGSAIDTGRDAGAAAAPSGNFAASGTGDIGGDGKYDPDNVGTTTNFADRAQRALVASVRVALVGMNATPDGKYVAPTETIASIKNYRQYALESLVVPRNLGLTGFPEPSFNPPAPPSIIGMCVGHCGAPVIYWQPPPNSGDVTKYRVEWDTVEGGAYTNGVDIDDPNARSAVLPDLNPASDVSQLRWYQMWSFNDNGRSTQPSNRWSATPTNRTRPKAPTNFDGVTNQVNQIPLSWKAPKDNDPAKSALVCSGTGGSTDGGAIPAPQEVVKYNVYRGTDANFNPDNGEGIKVLDFTTLSQPPQGAGGATVPWADTGMNNASLAPPANCTPYYYRVKAMDRCYKQATWNAGGTTADSISDYYPAIGNPAIGPFQSTYGGAAPAVPPTITVDKTTPMASGCPDPTAPTSTNCRITLQWNKSTSDTANPAVPIRADCYVITPAQRLQQVVGDFKTDTSFHSNGQYEINCKSGVCASGYSQSPPSAPAEFIDLPPMLDSDGQVLEYQYRVAAKNCSLYSGVSPNSISEAAKDPNPTVIYPGCSVQPTIVQNGASNYANGTVGGNSPQDPWIFNSNDIVMVTPPSGVTVKDVKFALFNWPSGSLVGTELSPAPSGSPATYTYTYSDQTDSQIYLLRIIVDIVDSQGKDCQEVHVKYIQDQQQAPCVFTSLASAPGPQQGNGSTRTGSFDFNTASTRMTNSGTENIKFVISGSFTGSAKVTWKDTTGDHPEMMNLMF